MMSSVADGEEIDKPKDKPLFFIANSRKKLRHFPDEVKHVLGYALRQAQQGGKHQDAKVLKGFGGAGVLEIVEDYDGSTYRGVYTVRFADIVYLLDAFQKKSKKGIKTPKPDMDRIKARLKDAERHYTLWRRTQEQREE